MQYINLLTGIYKDIIAPPTGIAQGGAMLRVVERILDCAPDMDGGRRIVVDGRDWPFRGNISLFADWRMTGLALVGRTPLTTSARLPLGGGVLVAWVRGEVETEPPRRPMCRSGSAQKLGSKRTWMVRAPDDGKPHFAIGVAPTADGARQTWAALSPQFQNMNPSPPWAAYTARPDLPPEIGGPDMIQFGAAFAWAVMRKHGAV